jgi:hypothetical protein
MDNEEKQIKNNNRFIRWQQILREHLTFLNNLLLTFSVGALGFLFSLLNDSNFTPICCQKIFFTSGLIFIFLSILIGLITSFSRLVDFRTTLKKIKNELNGDHSELENLKVIKDFYGKSTWNLFYNQVIIFTIGIISLTIAFLMIYQNKLF